MISRKTTPIDNKLQYPSGSGAGVPDVARPPEEKAPARPSCVFVLVIGAPLRTIGGESRRWGAIMPGHLQDGFGCVVTNRFDQLLDDESDPFEILKAAESKKKEAAGAAGKSAAQAAKQPRKEPGKDRKNPLSDKKEEVQAPVPLKKDGWWTLCLQSGGLGDAGNTKTTAAGFVSGTVNSTLSVQQVRYGA